MPTLRTLLPILVALLLLGPVLTDAGAMPAAVTPSSGMAGAGAVLPLLVTRGHAPAAALLDRQGTCVRYAHAGQGITRADHFRAGSITNTAVRCCPRTGCARCSTPVPHTARTAWACIR